MPATPANIVVSTVELLLLLAGAILLWRFALSRSARTAAVQAGDRLAPWNITVQEFFLYVLVIIGGTLVASFVCEVVVRPFHLSADTKTILGSAAFQIGMLIGPAFLPLQLGHHPLNFMADRRIWISGLVTFLIALPIVTVVNVAWLGFLKLAGLPAEQQDLLRLFSQADTAGMLVLMVGLATVVAPIAEELLFRATVFRYVRTRLPRWIALLGPGLVFAALHVQWPTLDGLASFAPLVTLAIVFSLAYERTGRIGTAIVAHALFNLHTLLILFSGVTE